jgi:lipoprotein-anchoring transpeptidase ErfK/SrfK
MRHKLFILVVALGVAVIAGGVGAYAYDRSRDDLITEGVTIAGIDVGGMRADQARRVVRSQLEAKLAGPIVVRYGRARSSLSARDARVRVDVRDMVDEAVAQSRAGTILARVARDLTGGENDAKVPARVSYSRAAVGKLVGRVKKRLDRPARDARVDFPAMTKVKEQIGRRVNGAALRRRVVRALTVPGADRTVRPPTRKIQPKVTRADLADRYPLVLVADRANFKLRLYRRLRLAKEYTVAVGAVGFDTPAGLYHIQNKAVDPAWSVPEEEWAGALAGTVVPGGAPDNPLKERWLGIYDGAGIHGTDQTYSLGSAASHGCIRMAIPDVIELYDQVPVGTPIYVA